MHSVILSGGLWWWRTRTTPVVGFQGCFQARICSPNEWKAHPGRISQPGNEAIRNNEWTSHENHLHHQNNQGELRWIWRHNPRSIEQSKQWQFKPLIPQLQKTVHCHDVQLIQDEPVQSCTYPRALVRRRSTGSGEHDDQEDVPGGHHSPKEKARTKAKFQWARSAMRRSKPTQRTTRTTWPLSTDEGPGLRWTNQALKAIVADMPPAEETIRPDPDWTNEEAQAETTPTGTTNSAIFASCIGALARRMSETNQRKQALPRCPGLNILAKNLLHGGEPRNQICQLYWSLREQNGGGWQRTQIWNSRS